MAGQAVYPVRAVAAAEVVPVLKQGYSIDYSVFEKFKAQLQEKYGEKPKEEKKQDDTVKVADSTQEEVRRIREYLKSKRGETRFTKEAIGKLVYLAAQDLAARGIKFDEAEPKRYRGQFTEFINKSDNKQEAGIGKYESRISIGPA